MAGHIHDADLFSVRKREPAEAEVDRHLAFAFLFQAVGVDAGERGDERGFAMVNVTCGANNAHLNSRLKDE
jgi:hypothetical protein